MSSTSKNTIILVAVVLVIVALFFVFKNRMDQNEITPTGLNATSTSNVSGGGPTGAVSSSGPGSTASVNSSATMATVNNNSLLNSLIDSALIRVPNTGVDVAFTMGKATFVNGSVKGTITRGPILGKIPTNDGYDVFTTMTIVMDNSSSSLQYIALFKLLNSNITYTSAVVVGDRLNIQSIAASGNPDAPITAPTQYFDSKTTYNLAINYLDRKNGEPVTATPTLSKSLNVRVKNHLISR